jgi:hypothetical protein
MNSEKERREFTALRRPSAILTSETGYPLSRAIFSRIRSREVGFYLLIMTCLSPQLAITGQVTGSRSDIGKLPYNRLSGS